MKIEGHGAGAMGVHDDGARAITEARSDLGTDDGRVWLVVVEDLPLGKCQWLPPECRKRLK